MRKIIGIAGLIGAGKTAAAMHLVEEHNFRRIPFAGALKDMLRALGLSEREINADKEKPCALLGGKTPRWAMQVLGTEWGRELIDQQIWVRAWKHAVDSVPAGIGVVADDMRFQNEAIAVRCASPLSVVVRIARTEDCGRQTSHVSELQNFRADVTILNNGGVNDLKTMIDELVAARVKV